jgi:hypothetical protein
MAGYVQDNAASVRGVALRVTRLGADGAPLAGGANACDSYMTGGFITASFTPSYSEGDEIEVKNAAGEVCVYFKMPDTLKNVGMNLELCDPDPVLTQMLVGGDVLEAAYNSSLAPPGMSSGQVAAVGYAAESIGVEATPYGVSVEIWAQAVVGGKAANVAPYWHYVWPYMNFRLDGDRVVENGALATVFAGTGGGNSAFGAGPNLDTTGITPLPSATAWDWNFPSYSDRPYMYARAVDAPVGLRGCFVNLGIPVTAITAGIPATLTPSNATRPASLTNLTAKGALGNVTAWTTGQYVVLADGTEAYWDGNSWESGRKPATAITPTSAAAGAPGIYGPTGAANAANLAGLSTVTAVPTSVWTTGQYVNLADGAKAYWNGSAWATGTAP